jgi:hypothetical protein
MSPKTPFLDALNQGVHLGSMVIKRPKPPFMRFPSFFVGFWGLAKSLFLQGQIKYFYSPIIELALKLILLALGRIGRYHITL